MKDENHIWSSIDRSRGVGGDISVSVVAHVEVVDVREEVVILELVVG
jgi:hypothetical protein